MNILRLQSKISLFKFSKRFCSVLSSDKDGLVPATDPLTATTYRDHIYCKHFERTELVNYLFDNIVFNEDGIIVINKPSGLRVKKKVNNSKNTALFGNLSLEDVSSDLAQKLNVNSLESVIFPLGPFSGVTVLAASEKSKENLKKVINHRKKNSAITYEALAITVGKPNKSFLKTKIVTNLQKQKKLEKNDICWQHKVISTNMFTSLVRVKASRPNIDFNLASQYFTPVLGDYAYGTRVKKANDVYFFTEKSERLKTQDIPSEVLSALEVGKEEVSIIPSHLHFHAISFHFKKNIKFIVSVPPPEHFIWTCQKLNLVDEEVARDKAQFAIL